MTVENEVETAARTKGVRLFIRGLAALLAVLAIGTIFYRLYRVDFAISALSFNDITPPLSILIPVFFLSRISGRSSVSDSKQKQA